MSTHRPGATVEIDAPLDVVWDVMLDAGAYAEWNPFVVRVETPDPPRVGNPIVLHVKWADGGGARSPERIAVVEPPTTDVEGVLRADLAYTYAGAPARLGLVRSIRHQRLEQRPGGPTVYDTEMLLTGPLARVAGPARITDGFRRHAEALRERAESRRPG